MCCWTSYCCYCHHLLWRFLVVVERTTLGHPVRLHDPTLLVRCCLLLVGEALLVERACSCSRMCMPTTTTRGQAAQKLSNEAASFCFFLLQIESIQQLTVAISCCDPSIKDDSSSGLEVPVASFAFPRKTARRPSGEGIGARGGKKCVEIRLSRS